MTEELKHNNITQYFSQEGMMESTSKVSDQIFIKIFEAIKDFGVPVSLTRKFKTESKQLDGIPVPATYFQGEELSITITVPATDKFGNNGRQFLTPKEYETLNKKVVEANMSHLVMEDEEAFLPKDEEEVEETPAEPEMQQEEVAPEQVKEE